MKKRTSSCAIATLVIALATALCLVIMLLMTLAVAGNYKNQICTLVKTHAKWDDTLCDDIPYDDIQELPGAKEVSIIRKLGLPYLFLRTEPLFPFELQQMPDSMDSSHWLWDNWDLLYGCDFSVIHYTYNEVTGNSDPLITSGNRIYFTYMDESSWSSSQSEPQGYAWVDLDAIPGAAKIMHQYIGYHALTGSMHDANMSLPVIRVTGWFENNQFHTVTLERGCHADSTKIADDTPLLNHPDNRQLLQWHTLLETDAPAHQPLVTIYGWDVDGITGIDQNPVTVDGITYANLAELQLSTDHYYELEYKDSLWESVFFRTAWYNDHYGDYTYDLVIRYWPMQYAMLRLIPAYLGLAAVVAVAVLLILRRIRKSATTPLKKLSDALKTGDPITPSADWAEPNALENQLNQIRQSVWDSQAENTRLETALDYAKEAEEKRKELISNLAHELKTPLAVIHSYSEGLQEGIAPEKREQYIQTILDEANRMDTMVMQMLQLSRLEAGKAKLNMETFPLCSLIRSVAEKLQPLMEEKNLNLQLEVDDDAQMDGDIHRMEQVITNYMSNAVKYTPESGRILIKVTQGKHGIFFSITNTASHLPEEALNRVYDSFYRQETARTEKNSGLGLAIVKSIMTLHGYQCYVLNSLLDGSQAVEFGFFPNE